jgi:hypothetical protein
MKRHLVGGLVALLVGVPAAAQDASAKPAMKSDFALAMTQLDRAASKKLGLTETKFTGDQGEITRLEIVAQLDAMMTKYRPKFRVTPRPSRVYEDVIKAANSDEKTRAQLLTLSKWNLIGPVGPLAAGKSAGLTNEQLGDALGYFYVHVMVYSHQPDPRWTPSLQSGE